MAKKKSKKGKKQAESQPQEHGLNLFGHQIGKLGTTFLSTLIAEVVAVTLDRLLKTTSSAAANTSGNQSDSPDRTSLAQVLTNLPADLKTVKDAIQQPLTDAIATTKSVAQDLPTEVNQGIDLVQSQVGEAIAQPATRAKQKGVVMMGELVDTAKTVVHALSSKDTDQPAKKKKKKK